MSAPPYPKIENRFQRREDHTLNLEQIRRAAFGLVDRWMATEKIDGTNIRVSLEEQIVVGGPGRWRVKFYGRTNKAQMPDFIQEYLEATFKLDGMEKLWQCRRNCEKCDGHGVIPGALGGFTCENFEPYPITLYGEAYGARIQKGGGDYRKGGDISFRLFDVLVGENYWLGWDNITSIAKSLGVKTVPLVSTLRTRLNSGGSLLDTDAILTIVRAGFKSIVAEEEGTPRLAEGIVARTDPYLFDGQGRRVVWKSKTKDFHGGLIISRDSIREAS